MTQQPYNDTWGEELQADQETFHPMSNIETYIDGLTAEQRASMSEDSINEHYKVLYMVEALRSLGYLVVNEPIKFFHVMCVAFKPELSLTEMCAFIRKVAMDLIKSSSTKQNIQQGLKSLWDDPIHGSFFRTFLSRDSGEVKAKKDSRLTIKKPQGSKTVFDDQIRMDSLLDD